MNQNERWGWLLKAACRGRDPELYSYDAYKAKHPKERPGYLQFLCPNTCPVRNECAFWARADHSIGVIRAGIALPAQDKTATEVRRKAHADLETLANRHQRLVEYKAQMQAERVLEIEKSHLPVTPYTESHY